MQKPKFIQSFRVILSMSNSVCQFYKLTLIELLQNIQLSFQQINSFSHSKCSVLCNTYLNYVIKIATLAYSELGADTINVWQVVKLLMQGGAVVLTEPCPASACGPATSASSGHSSELQNLGPCTRPLNQLP